MCSDTNKIRVDLTGAPETMLATLCARALDADADQPILGDTYAKELVARLDYDWPKTGVTGKRAIGDHPQRAFRPMDAPVPGRP